MNLAPELMKINMLKAQTWADLAEKIRARIVSCMTYGRCLVLNLDQSTMNFQELDTEGVLPLSLVFDHDGLIDNARKIIKREEDKDKAGTEGQFHVS